MNTNYEESAAVALLNLSNKPTPIPQGTSLLIEVSKTAFTLKRSAPSTLNREDFKRRRFEKLKNFNISLKTSNSYLFMIATRPTRVITVENYLLVALPTTLQKVKEEAAKFNNTLNASDNTLNASENDFYITDESSIIYCESQLTKKIDACAALKICFRAKANVGIRLK